MDDKKKIEIVEKFGWKLIEGFYFDAEEIDLVEYNKFFVSKEHLDDYIHKCEFWQNEDEENVYEKHEIDDLLEFLGEVDILEGL